MCWVGIILSPETILQLLNLDRDPSSDIGQHRRIKISLQDVDQRVFDPMKNGMVWLAHDRESNRQLAVRIQRVDHGLASGTPTDRRFHLEFSDAKVVLRLKGFFGKPGL